MKHRSTAATALLAVLLACAACSRQRSAGNAGAAGDSAGTASAPAVAALHPAEPSLFELAFALTDADAKPRHLGEFRGQVFVASMIYTHCTSVCPRIIAALQRLERALPDDVRSRTRFVLLSLDPERDTPAALRAFAQDHALDPARWTLLAAEPDDMRTLAAVIDVRFRPDAGGEIAHSAVIVVVGGDGVIRYRQVGLDADPSALVTAVRAAQ